MRSLPMPDEAPVTRAILEPSGCSDVGKRRTCWKATEANDRITCGSNDQRRHLQLRKSRAWQGLHYRLTNVTIRIFLSCCGKRANRNIAKAAGEI